MNQKQYHSLEEFPMMMNMADVAAALGIPEPERTNSPTAQTSRRFRSANGLSFRVRNSSIGWTGSVRNKNARKEDWTCYSAVFVVIVLANRKRRR